MSTEGGAPRRDIIDYEGSRYRHEFWEDANRAYEDRVERVALRRLLPASGRRLLEVGAGYGRLTPEYRGFDQVVLLDYSLTHLQDAQRNLGRDKRFLYVAADVCQQPFCGGAFDATTTIRVLHHLLDVPGALAETARVLATGGVLVLEHASKRHLKSALRHALGLQKWSPYSLEPLEFVKLNFDFHPEYMRQQLAAVGFRIDRRLPVSWMRLGLLKSALPTGLLVRTDSLLQHSGALWSPSVFVRATREGPAEVSIAVDDFLRCPRNGEGLRREGDSMVSVESGRRWAIRDGIYDFREPLT
ncbi:MAG: class I SAM-dependent methyltransferase [Anaerolineaceae bacterium]|nr:class I SAM-dependent methyltransferase [Anaerolineaceae bacterium]